MGECRFESPYDGYGGVFCTVHDGEITPVLCAYAAADLEEEKAQAVKRAQVLADDKCRHFYDRAVQAEVREAAMRAHLELLWKNRVEWHLHLRAQVEVQAALSTDVGRVKEI